MDVKLTADGEVVVIHDQTVDRTTNGKGAVASLTLEEIQSLDAGVRFGRAFEDCRIPTLAEVFSEFGNLIRYDVELTHYRSPFDALPYKVVEQIKKYRLESNVIVSSFMPAGLIRVKRCLPDMPVGLIASRGFTGALSRSRLGWLLVKELVIPHISGLDEGYVRKQQRRHRAVIPWTVNEVKDLQRCRVMGICAIITDVPDRMRQALQETR